MTEPKTVNIDKLREKLNLIIKWLGNEYLLKVARPDLYDLWIEYASRTGMTCWNAIEHERMFNMWLLHYFLVHDKK